ncbi:MAG: 3-isopropylmalate dehydratase small subunit, partial [Omnitrophica WOR_2 bacterium GWA2_37_7]
NSTVLLARDNFGCGSSREHAPWALYDYGFRVIIAPSFADIFYNNCIKNGILLVRLKEEEVDSIFDEITSKPGTTVTADLGSQAVTTSGRKKYTFDIHPFAKDCLLKGLDHIGWTLQFSDQINSYEEKIKKEKPWIV